MSRFPVPARAGLLSALLTLPLAACAARTPADAAAAARVELPADATVDGLRIEELSGLAWDADEQLLYAVSDRGAVFHFRVDLAEGRLSKVVPVRGARLRAGDGADGFNAEGLALRNAANGVRGDSELVVSLEGDPPRVMRFGPDGLALGALPVPAPADDPARYRKRGRGLEAVALLDDDGVLTAPESPLVGADEQHHAVYADGRQWRFPRAAPDSRLKAMDLLAPGRLLVLERSKAGGKALQASLRTVALSG
ncbi:MAG TPA: esterase-like activity of phytase family protein, partial [Lysobacter sp.]